MVLESEIPVFSVWVWQALLFFVQAALVFGVVALVGGFLIAAVRYGPLAGGDAVYRMLRTGVVDVLSISPRRILALARLAVQESLRRRVLVGFGLFLVILLFAGWFLDNKTSDPAALYVSFVLTSTTYLVLLMALFLSAFSLPADIKNHTIYTVVTKPVRPGEIVLGRILGFSLIGTLLLAAMGLISYVFVLRLLNHSHEVDLASVKTVSGEIPGKTGRTTLDQSHRHQFTLDAEGNGETDIVNGHLHEVTSRVVGDKTVYEVGPPRDLFAARVPQYGDLRFKDRSGTGSDRGINVGNEWKYRSYIEGASDAEAIWTFGDVTPERFPDGLPVEMTVRVFRSYKGEIEQGIRGSIVLRNPRTQRKSQLYPFSAKEFFIDHLFIDRKLADSNGEPIDLFKDLAPDGELEISLQCIDHSQYFGVAKGDVYLRARDASFAMNFLKSFLGIWVQMLLVTSFGVMYSTFLSGPVAMLATLATLVLGFFGTFVKGVASQEIQGGGPIESLVRLVQQQNVVTQLEPGLTSRVIKGADNVFMVFLQSFASLIPDFRKFSNVEYVAHGFDIPPDLIGIQVLTSLAYLAAVFAIGYFFLRTREVAR